MPTKKAKKREDGRVSIGIPTMLHDALAEICRRKRYSIRGQLERAVFSYLEVLALEDETLANKLPGLKKELAL